MKIGVIGLGYIGLPLSVAFAEEGHEVVGPDTDGRKVASLGEGRSYVEDVSDEALRRVGDEAVRLHALRARARDGRALPARRPFYLAVKAREADFYPEFIELAGKINQAQPQFCVERIERALNDVGKPVKGSRILILGVSYKCGVGDVCESPALKIIRRLRELGAEIDYHDPHVPQLGELSLTSSDLGASVAAADLVAIVTAHPELDYEGVVADASLVVDFRGVTRGIAAANLVRL